MSFWTFLKVLSDCCVCFSVLAALPGVFVHDYFLLWPALLCAAGAGLAAWLRDLGRDGLRFLGLALPLCTLLIPDSTGGMLILLPVIAYASVVIVRGELTLEYYSFRQYFKGSLIFLLCLLLALSALEYLDATMNGSANFDSEAAMLYGVLHAVLGIVLLRQLRLGADEASRKMDRRQSILVLGGTGAVVLGIISLERWMHQSLMEMLQKLLYTVLAPLLMLLNLFNTQQAETITGIFGQTQQKPQGSTVPPQVTLPMVTVQPEQPAPTQPEEPFPWLMVLALVVLAVVMAFMLRSFGKRSAAAASEEVEEELAPESRRKRSDTTSNRSRIRRYYREFLKQERKRGQKLTPNQTSLDILQEISEEADSRAAAQLRQAYLAARYDETGDISQDQVRQAKAALKKSRGS